MVPKIFFPFKGQYIQYVLWGCVLTIGSGEKQDYFVFDSSVLSWLFLAIMFSSKPHIKVMCKAWFKIIKARKFKGCI